MHSLIDYRDDASVNIAELAWLPQASVCVCERACVRDSRLHVCITFEQKPVYFTTDPVMLSPSPPYKAFWPCVLNSV